MVPCGPILCFGDSWDRGPEFYFLTCWIDGRSHIPFGSLGSIPMTEQWVESVGTTSTLKNNEWAIYLHWQEESIYWSKLLKKIAQDGRTDQSTKAK